MGLEVPYYKSQARMALEALPLTAQRGTPQQAASLSGRSTSRLRPSSGHLSDRKDVSNRLVPTADGEPCWK